MIYGFGKACVDYLCDAPSYPDENQQCTLSTFTKNLGGMAANAIRVASRFGAETSLSSFIGDDDESDRVLGLLEHERINTSLMIRTPGPMDLSFIPITRGNRTIFHYANSQGRAWPNRKIDFSPEDILLIDFTTDAGLEDLLGQAKEKGAKVVMDVSPTKFDPVVEESLKYVDYCIPCLEWAEKFADSKDPVSIADRLISSGASNVILTDGENGIHGFSGGQYIRLYSPEVDVVDSNGAGDTFHGAFCYALSEGYDIEKALAFSVICASFKCRSSGIPESLPVIGEVTGNIDRCLSRGQISNL